MRQSGALLAICLSSAVAFAPQAVAQAEDRSEVTPEKPDELSKSLGEIIDQALDEGLLSSPNASPNTEAPVGTRSLRSVNPAAPIRTTCSDGDPIDFSRYRALESYFDVGSYRTAVRSADEGSYPAAQQSYVEALIALGMHDEARLELSSVSEDKVQIFNAVSNLLRTGRASGSSLLTARSDCYNDRFWRSVAFIAEGDPRGVAAFSDALPAFRNMSYQMRVAILSIVIPELVGGEGQLLTEQALATFSPDAIDASKDLTFLKHIVEYGRSGDLESDVLRTYLMDPAFRTDALELLANTHDEGESRISKVPLQELESVIQASDYPRDVELSLTAVLERLSTRRDYEAIIGLADESGLRDARWQHQIAQSLGATLSKDLSHPERPPALRAFDWLIQDTPLLELYDERQPLYLQAVERAESEFYRSLAARFADMVGHDDAENSARIAYSTGAHTELFELAEAHPTSVDVNLLAAMAAIKDGNTALLAGFERRITDNPEALFSLIEADMLARTWIVSDASWRKSENLEDEDLAKRAAQMRRIRAAEQRAGNAPQNITINKAAALLSGSKEWLESRKEGGS